MDMFLTAGGERLRIPLLPDRFSVKMGATSIGFSVIGLGEHKIPRGQALTGYSWNGVFPGEGMSKASFVFDWLPPNTIIALLKRWLENGTILNFMVTETTVNDQVFIENFVFDHFGVDNVSYTLTLTKYRPIYITTAPPQPEVSMPAPAEPQAAETTKTDYTPSETPKPTPQASATDNESSPQSLVVDIPTNSYTNPAANSVKRSVTVRLNNNRTMLME